MPHKPQPLSSTAWLLFVGAGGGDGGGGEGGGGGDGGAASGIQTMVPLDCGCFFFRGVRRPVVGPQNHRRRKKKIKKSNSQQQVPPKTWAYTYVTFRESGGPRGWLAGWGGGV